MPNGTYGGVRGRKTKVGRKLSFSSYSIYLEVRQLLAVTPRKLGASFAPASSCLTSYHSSAWDHSTWASPELACVGDKCLILSELKDCLW